MPFPLKFSCSVFSLLLLFSFGPPSTRNAFGFSHAREVADPRHAGEAAETRFAVRPVGNFLPPAGADDHSFAGMENEILRLVNRHRRSIGRAPLQMNALESGVARSHSQDMATGRSSFGHDGFKERIARLNKKMGAFTQVAENVAEGQQSAREVVEDWLQSPGHRRNIEGDFRLTGIGLVRASGGMIYFTQIFTR